MTSKDPLTLELDGSAINDIPGFYTEINRVFMSSESWRLGGSLDALDDMLYGGYGALAGHDSATVIWNDMEHSRLALGKETTRAWLQAKLVGNGAFNARAIAEQLQALEAEEGQTYFQIVMEIFAAHTQLALVPR